MKLYYRELGKGQPLIFLHGIFGSSDNWLTQTRMLSARFRTFALDLRNHGQSPHDEVFDYPSMAADILDFIKTKRLSDAVLIGHSLGGKVAMNFAVGHPDKLQKLVVVDIAPKPYSMSHYAILEGLLAIPIDKITSREEADGVLAQFVEEPDIRQFLLKNLKRKPAGGFEWKLNLPVISGNIEKTGVDLQVKGTFDKPALFVRGARSNYVKDSDMDRIREIFPAAEMESFDTGHWLPAEKPKEFVELIERWVSRDP